MKEDEIKRVISDYFHRHYRGITRMTYPEATRFDLKRVDLMFVQGRRDRLHIVEAEPTLERCFNPFHGFVQLSRLKGNYKWLAIPLDEFYRNPIRIEDECKRRGIGLIVVYGKRRTRRVREEIQPRYRRGNFLFHFPEACNEWHQYALSHPKTHQGF